MSQESAEPGVGHNSQPVAAGELRSFIDRITKLMKEKDDLTGDIREVFQEAKGRGYDAATIRRVIARAKQDFERVKNQEALLELYLQALGME